MKAIIALMILAVIFDYTQAQWNITDFGTGMRNSTVDEYGTDMPDSMNCTIKEHLSRNQKCQTSFLQKLQKNPTSKCSREYDELLSCLVKVGTGCSNFAPSDEKILRMFLRKQYNNGDWCNKAGQYITVTNITDASLVCSMSYRDFANELNKCSVKLVKMWQANRADKRICSEFVQVRECQKKVLNEACKGGKDKPNEIYASLYHTAKYNPFCPNGVDSTSTSLMTRPSHGLLVLLVFAALVKSFKF